jgi:hypothetical protein
MWVNLIKVLYTHVWNKVKSSWTIDIHFKNVGQEGRTGPFWGVLGRREGVRNMVDVICIHVWKYNNETCWNCFKKGEGE